MRLEDQEIIDFYNELITRGHPDPVGFIARSEIISRLNPSRKAMGFQGPFATNIKKASEYDFTPANLKNNQDNFDAAVLIDGDSALLAGDDLEQLYRISYNQGSNKFDKFYKRLVKKRDELTDQFQFDEDGQLIALTKTEQKKPKEDNEGQVVTRQRKKQQAIADDFAGSRQPTLSLDQLESRLKLLIMAIVKEQVT